ncbi:SpoIIE family protein phosphatase [Halobacillus salinarum]|uniref:SpoIIE family protein phosphatase n=1 Tax=Halobacillus salinarum TaxID=2932257 RepID=A0ABY4EJR6_9BACI|nr:SpoIIE family protein phosphatase [Halobacillus salinarum]UOQ44341.1 SpoIIE family protein phosphatase [Halobacillus salinarum]
MEEDSKHVTISVYQEPKKGNYYCGDSYYYNETEDAFICALADGLGSGELASESSKAVMEVMEEYPNLEVEALVRKCNESLTGKRGVVLGVLRIDLNTKTYSYSSIGNIGVIIVNKDGTRTRNIPLAGYLAGFPRKLKVSRGVVHSGMIFLMFSDGVNERNLSVRDTITQDINKITQRYKDLYGGTRDDDTTLIAMEYK